MCVVLLGMIGLTSKFQSVSKLFLSIGVWLQNRKKNGTDTWYVLIAGRNILKTEPTKKRNKKADAIYVASILAQQRKRLERMIDKRGVEDEKKLFDKEKAAEIALLLASLLRRSSEPFSSLEFEYIMRVIRKEQMTISKKLSDSLSRATYDAQVEAVRGFSQDLAKFEKYFTGKVIVPPAEEMYRVQMLVDKSRARLRKMHDVSMSKYGHESIENIKSKLSYQMANDKTTGEALDAASKTITEDWWRVERIIRTEMAFAFNTAQSDAIKDAQEHIPDLMQRWSEHVNDETYEPYDDRVAVDSIAIHGQVTTPGGVFTMPPTALHPDAKGRTDVPSALVGQSWKIPPNRPNDRAVLQPWMKHWGIPGWVWKNESRLYLTE